VLELTSILLVQTGAQSGPDDMAASIASAFTAMRGECSFRSDICHEHMKHVQHSPR